MIVLHCIVKAWLLGAISSPAILFLNNIIIFPVSYGISFAFIIYSPSSSFYFPCFCPPSLFIFLYSPFLFSSLPFFYHHSLINLIIYYVEETGDKVVNEIHKLPAIVELQTLTVDKQW